ncbi:MAG: sugar phosphate isomerase/epimerase [Planctomycetes bacterium]|nr:sugar phosphate isomerase/epimerase [Planctomycetota bacterium]
MNRRAFVRGGALALTGLGLGLSGCKGLMKGLGMGKDFKISLAEWSLHRALYAKELDNLDFAGTARETYGIEAIEYVNGFFKDKAEDRAYLKQLNRRAADHGVRQLLIMIDGEGALGDPDEAGRTQTVENHKKWVEAAAFLGCHSIRVNALSEGTFDEQIRLCADGARRLTEFAAGFGINVIVENHGGNSSNGRWLAGLMEAVGLPGFGTLPDFGNFYDYDRYLGVAEMMPYAKAVSAKSRVFDAQGNEAETDYLRMMGIVLDAGYRGYVGIEYEGSELPEHEGILATKKLLERARAVLCG